MPITTIDIDEKLWIEMKEMIDSDKLEYPSMGNFINKAIKEKLKR